MGDNEIYQDGTPPDTEETPYEEYFEEASGSEEEQPNEGEGEDQGVVVERQARQRLEKENDFLRNSITRLEQRLDDLGQRLAPTREEEPDYDPDDFLTGKDVERIVQSRLEREREERKQNEEQNRQQRMMEQTEQFKKQHSDFEEVIALADDMVAQKPYLRDVIMNADNPAEAAYDIGLLHKDAQKVRKGKQTKKTPPNLSGTPGSSGSNGEIDWMKVPEEKWREEQAKILGLS